MTEPDSGRTPSGTRVTKTGIALVHEGEVILPAEGSEAEGELVVDDSRTVVRYVFPVEIEVCSTPAELDVDALVDEVLAAIAGLPDG